ncbi:Gfo/Idh/MocA family oxidoreductase [Halobacillus shinanisalinarum]|uniref:Gfo/Idh/MocA family oxidoreductase n=1 Tax=Halobacillus shinanisalinarum TaxID=2932258 RepID=A0ABY4GZ18_9BACI|nr:Gfo/Idh/MocA family oxidoreductase [Halobacillus shinanisalinarum]UOQ93309.1 Gfo/Idh/MocA family oxidoreductase [Halobacillus shinanisalinarum]
MNKVKVAVIGCGSIAQKRHLPEYKVNPYVEIVAVCDVVESRVAEVAEKYGARAFVDYKEVLQLTEVDAVSVCLPNYLHASVTIDALNAKKHVLCEKPMAVSLDEANEMNNAAKANQKKIMIAHNQRFVSSHHKAKHIIESGELGKIYSFRTTFGHGGPENWSIDGRTSWFFNKEEAFVGAMGDLGVHKADLIRYLLGEVSEVGAFVETSAKENTSVDDNAICILKMESGVVGTLTASWSYVSGGDNTTVIYGENGTIQLENDPDYSLKIDYKNGECVHYKLDKIQTNDEKGQTTTHVIDHFVDAIIYDRDPLVTGEEGIKSLQVILSALESNESKQITKINSIASVY